MKKTHLTLGVAFAALAAGSFPAVAIAQDSDVAASRENTGEIVVTARRRTEALTDVPIAISAVSAETIQQRGISSVDSVANMTPGLQFDKGASPADVRPSLRGISLIEGRSNVAIIVDGIDVTGVSLNTIVGGSGSQTAAALMDLERIEVVKGPQTVYFGRSAFAGAIQFISKKPEFTTGGSVSGAIGDYGRRELTGHITGPIIADKVAAKLSATYRNHGGFYSNPGNGMGLGASETYGIGGSVLVEGGPFEARVSLNYLNEHSTPGAAFLIERPDVTEFGVNVIDESTYFNNRDQIGISSHMDYLGNKSETWRGTANMKYDMGGGFELASTTGVNKVQGTIQFDFDTKMQNTPDWSIDNNCLKAVCVGIAEFDSNLQQISQELRLTYDSDNLRLLAGGYFFDENYEERDYTRFLNPATNVTETREGIIGRPSRLFTNTYSAFGSIDYDVTDRFTVTGELRFNHEKIRAEAATSFNILAQTGSTAINFRGEQTYNTWLPRLNAKYELTDDVNVYGSVAKGAKPGGFNVGAVIDSLRPFGQEKIWTYELGTKGNIAGRTISFDASLYYSDWRDVQVTTICYGTQSAFAVGGVGEAECPTATAVSLNYIINAQKAEVKGAEFGLVIRPADVLTLNLNYAYADSKFKDFAARDVYPAPAGTDRQFGGNAMPLVAKHSLSGSIRVEDDIANDVSAFVELSARYRSSRYARFDNRVQLAGKTVADVQFGLKGDDWSGLIFVDNIFNELTPDFARYWGNHNPGFGRPNGEFITAPAKRSFGVRVNKNF
jgi:iron complex outermembrane receptor protein